MNDLPVAAMTVGFERGASLQGLTVALTGLAERTEGLLEYWSSARMLNDVRYFRFGLRDQRATINGEPWEPSMDIVVVPHDGKEREWFEGAQRQRNVCVRSRACVDNLCRPLRDLRDYEAQIETLVRTVAHGLKEAVDELNRSTLSVG